MCHPEVPDSWEAVKAQSSERTITVSGGEKMPALRVGSHDAPGVLLIPDVFGRSAFYEQLAARIASQGFQVLLPEIFFRQGPLAASNHEAAFARRAQLDEEQSVEDMRAAVAWLGDTPGSQVGVIGFCMGGTFALDLASTEENLVTIAYYGFPVPQASVVHPPPKPLDLVDELHGPVLAFWGENDQAVGIENVEAYVARARESNPNFQSRILPGFGHGFLGSADLADPDDLATQTWNLTLSHLRDHLHEGS